MKHMDFQDFCNEVSARISEFLLDFEIHEIRVVDIPKNNGIELKALVIVSSKDTVYPAIYLQPYYQYYCRNGDMEQVLQELATQFRERYRTMDIRNPTMEELRMLQRQVFFCLVNYEKNEKMLQECPHLPFYDMAIVFRYLVHQDDTGIASAILKNEDMKRIGLDHQSLYNLAYANTRLFLKPQLVLLSKLLRDRYEYEVPDIPEIYVLSSHNYMYGAGMILYPELLEQVAREYDGDFFIIPSSIHEVLICTMQGEEARQRLQEILQEVNEFVVEEGDYLSDQLYRYDKKIGKILI